ncbi:MAG: EamA family transporter [Chitinivibrionales bacterium]|nr:EamA family transporter [Chitinivibrionales bacterium]
MVYRYLLLLFGVYMCSTAVILIKVSAVHPFVLAASRQLIAAAMLTPLCVGELRSSPDISVAKLIKAAWLPGILLGLHFMSWIVAARMTLAANASLIVNMVPVVMPFIMIVLVEERLNAGEVVGTILATAGILALGVADFHISRQTFLGDALAFGSMLMFACYLGLARRSRKNLSLWVYVVPVYWAGGLFCLPFALMHIEMSYTMAEIMIILGLAVLPTVLGHSILNYSMQKMRGQIVSILNLGQFIFAGIMGYFLLHEIPQPVFYAASLCIVCGAFTAIRFAPRGNG